MSLCDLGDGVESQCLQESPTMSSSIVIPEHFESHNEMVRSLIIVILTIINAKIIQEFVVYFFLVKCDLNLLPF